MATFGEVLRRIRTERNLKQTDITVQGVTPATISQYESNRRVPSFEILQALAEKLDISVSAFFPDIETKHHTKILTTLLHQAELAEKRKDWEAAIEAWDAALMFCQSHHIEDYLFYIQQHKGTALAKMERYEDSIDTLLTLIVHRDFTKDKNNTYEVLWILGKCARALEQWEQSITFARLAAQAVGPSDERWIRMHINMGSGYNNLGAWEQSIETFYAALTRAKETGNGLLEAWAHVGITAAYIGEEILEDVPVHLSRAESLNQLMQDEVLNHAISQSKLAYYRSVGKWSEAKKLIIQLMEEVDSSDHQQEAELIHETLLVAAMSSDPTLGQRALHEFQHLPVKGPIRGLLWLAVAEYYLVTKQTNEANHALRYASSLLSGYHYRDTSPLVRLIQLLERRYKSYA